MKTGMKTGFFALIFLLSSTLQSFASYPSLHSFTQTPPFPYTEPAEVYNTQPSFSILRQAQYTKKRDKVIADGTTSLTGGAITADELNLDTGELVVQDLNIYDESQDFSVGGTLSLSKGTGENASNSYGNIDYKNEGHITEGEINSTIASNGGTITIGGKETSQEELEELGVNTDLDNLHIIIL